MKLRTSFFNATVLKKDITRFAPLWGLYTVFMLLVVLAIWGDYTEPARFAGNADEIMVGMGVVNFIYAGLAALCLFGDLFKQRLCNALHAMPLRREGWFLTHCAAGFLFCLGPNALGAVLAAAMLGQYAYLAYVWLALMLLQYLCFFGIAAFSAQCAGNLLGAAAVYGIVNFLSVLALWLVKCFYEPVLFGVTVNGERLAQFSPAVGFSIRNYVDVDYDYETGVATFVGFNGESWMYALLAALAGVALLVAAVFMYRRRKLESAGDFIAFRPAGPVFLVLYSLCVGAVLYAFAEAVDNGLGTYFLMVGLAIGWFTGLMLLQKRVNVFRAKTLVGLGVLVFALYLSVSVVWMDPIGITRYVPAPSQVQSVAVSPYPANRYHNRNASRVTDPAQIEKLTQIHENLVEKREENTLYTPFRITYTMKTGVVVERNYYLNAFSEDGKWLNTIYSSMETVLGNSDLGAMKRSIRYAEVYSYSYKDEKYLDTGGSMHFEIQSEDYSDLLDALAADCQAGKMTQVWDYRQNEEQVANINLQFGQGIYQDIQVYDGATNTVAYLQQLAAKLETEEQ